MARDSDTDLAVIKIQAPEPLQVIRIGTSSDLMAGEPVIAIGNAFGYEHTVTRGIISALNRDVQVSETQSYDDLIQTDASINPGNSGGPLLNIDGEMIGVNVAVRAGAQGIGFAIPVDTAVRVAAELMSVERLENKWHGLGHAQNRRRAVAARSRRSSRPARPPSAVCDRATRSSSVGSLPDRAAVGLGAGDDRLREDGQSVPLDVLPRRSYAHAAVGAGPLPGRHRRTKQNPSRNDSLAWKVFGLDLVEDRGRRFRSAVRAIGAACGWSACGPTARPRTKASCPATSWSACIAGKRPRRRHRLHRVAPQSGRDGRSEVLRAAGQEHAFRPHERGDGRHGQSARVAAVVHTPHRALRPVTVGGMETEFVRWLRDRLPASPRVPLGLGDDAAILALAGDPHVVVTTDLLTEGSTFTWRRRPAADRPQSVGRESQRPGGDGRAAAGGGRGRWRCRATAAAGSRRSTWPWRSYEGLLPLAASSIWPSPAATRTPTTARW